MKTFLATFVTLITLSSSVAFALDTLERKRVPIAQCFKAYERGKVLYEMPDPEAPKLLYTYIVWERQLYMLAIDTAELENLKSTHFCDFLKSVETRFVDS